jgi:anti-sigma factor RsiW
MNCQEIKKLLIPFLESELSESDRAIVEAHLQSCVDCQKEKMLLEKTWSMLDGLGSPKVSSDFTMDLMAKIYEQEEEKPKFTFAFPNINIQFGFRELALASVSACVLIAAYLIVQNHLISKQQVAKDTSSEQEYLMQAKKDASIEPIVNVAEVTPIAQKEEVKIASTELVKDKEVKIAAADEEIIRNLDVYENSELYQNYTLLNDLDVVENLEAEAS